MKETYRPLLCKKINQPFTIKDQNINKSPKSRKISKPMISFQKIHTHNMKLLSNNRTQLNKAFPIVKQSSKFQGINFDQIHNHLLNKKSNNQCKTDPFAKQTDINRIMRATLFNWLLEVATKLKLKKRTIHLCANIFDRYLLHSGIDKKTLQLLGITCFYIASKFEDIYPPKAQDLCFLCNNIYSPSQVVELEGRILSAINFNLIFVSALDVAELYLAKTNISDINVSNSITAILDVFMVQGTTSMIDSFKLAEFACTLVQAKGNITESHKASDINSAELQKLKLCFKQMVINARKYCLSALEKSFGTLNYELLSFEQKAN